ncbi:MAG: PIN domain-containing protein [Eggerthellaceae bacterium]|nr:PIN domain-containing protein [Eggerthellaceae bacterium]
MKSMKLLLDTNILVDFAIRREPHFESARKLMLLGYLKEVELWMGSSQVSDLVYVATGGGKARLAQQARELLDKLFQFVHVYATDEDDCAFMAKSDWSDLEDCLVYRNALGIKADGIVSRDKSGFAKSSIKVYDYEELFGYMKEVLDLDYELIEI